MRVLIELEFGVVSAEVPSNCGRMHDLLQRYAAKPIVSTNRMG